MRTGIVSILVLLLLLTGSAFAQKMTVKDSDSHVLMEVNDEGDIGSITLPSGSAPSTPANKLYNVSGSLFWNGSALGMAGSAGGWTDNGTIMYLSTTTDVVGVGIATPDNAKMHISDASKNYVLRTSTTRTADDTYGVYSETTGGTGISYGVAGISSSTSGTGVRGHAGASTGSTKGLWGSSNSSAGTGVYGYATSDAGTTYGVWGKVDSPSGYAGYFEGKGYFSDKVGIGTSSPGYPLEIEWRSGYGGIILDGWEGSAEHIYFEENGAIKADLYYTPNSGGYFNIYAYCGGIHTDIYMKNGRVGIQEDTPSTTLDVGGTARMTGFQLPTGASSGHVLTSDGSGVGTWQAASGGDGHSLDAADGSPVNVIDVDNDGETNISGPVYGSDVIRAREFGTGGLSYTDAAYTAAGKTYGLHAVTTSEGKAVYGESSGMGAHFKNTDGPVETWIATDTEGLSTTHKIKTDTDLDVRGTIYNQTGNVTVNDNFIVNNQMAIGGSIQSGSTLYVNGTLGVSSFDPTTNYDVGLSLAGNLTISTSSMRYKDDIRPMNIDPKDVLSLEPVRFSYKGSGQDDFGLIAEDVDKHVRDLVAYDKEGQPDGVKYSKLAVFLLEVVKQQQQELEEQKERIATLERGMEE